MEKDYSVNEVTQVTEINGKGGRAIIRLMIAVFFSLTLGAGIFSLAVKDREFSENENRVL